MRDVLGHHTLPDRERTFTLIRHGSTALNSSDSADRIRGWSNLPVNAAGEREAKELADKLKNSGIRLIVSSDLKRAMTTADALADTTGADVVASKKLRPWNVGDYTGELSSKVLKVLGQYAEEAPDKRVPGGESFADFRDRTFDGVREALREARTRQLAIVTHHRVERLLKAWIAAGQKSNRDVDLGVFLQRGEAPGHAERLTLKPARL